MFHYILFKSTHELKFHILILYFFHNDLVPPMIHSFLMEYVGLSENQSPVVFHLFKMYEGRSRLALIRTDADLGKCQRRVPGAHWYLRHTAASHALTLGESAE